MSGPYHQPWPTRWYLRRRGYLWFVARELTAVFIGAYLLFLLVFLYSLGAGPDRFTSMLAVLAHPLARAAHAIVLVAAAWHSITWFNLTPKAMPVHVGAKRVADPLVALAMGYLPWIMVTILILWGSCP